STPVEEKLAAIYAQVLGLERVGVDDSFFDLGGDSILSIQVASKARTMGIVLKSRDVFLEKTVAGVAGVAVVVDRVEETPEDGVGDVELTPIISWLEGVEGPIEDFNQAMILQAPAGVEFSDVVVLLQALLDRHDMLRAQVSTGSDGDCGWLLRVREPGSVVAAEHLVRVDSLSPAHAAEARSKLEHSAGRMISGIWAEDSSQLLLIIHHLVVDGVSWRILLDDINSGWSSYRHDRAVNIPLGGTSFRRWASLLSEYAHSTEVVSQKSAWSELGEVPSLLPAADPLKDTFATAGRVSMSLSSDSTRLLMGRVPAAFHSGVHEILLIAFGLAIAEFTDSSETPIIVDVEGHGRDHEFAADIDLTRTIGWFTTKYPVLLELDSVPWQRVIDGGEELGDVVKRAKERLRASPDGLTYGLLRYLNSDDELEAADPTIGFNYLGRIDASTGSSPIGDLATDGRWRMSIADDSLGCSKTAMPVMHTVEVNAVATNTADGLTLHASWTWATSKLDLSQVVRLGELWFEALEGIIDHVRDGGGGLTPSDVALASVDQHQIQNIEYEYDTADILPLAPLQEGLLFHVVYGDDAGAAYASQIDIGLAGMVDVPRLSDAVQSVAGRHPNLCARFVYENLDKPVQVILANPEVPWRFVDLADEVDDAARLRQILREERSAVCNFTHESPSRGLLVRLAEDRYRFVFTSHHIVYDGWSLPLVISEIFAIYNRENLRPAVPYSKFLSWLSEQDTVAAEDVWSSVFEGFETPTLVRTPDHGSRTGGRESNTYRMSARTTRGIRDLARSQSTTASTVVQAAWAQLLSSMTGSGDVAFGMTVSGRPADLAGAESMVGLFINTVPVRAVVDPAHSVSDLIDQLQAEYNSTLDHQHLALSRIHRVTGHKALFDTLFVFENYPIETSLAELGGDSLTVTDLQSHEANHYPLTIQVLPGDELGCRIEFRTDVFDEVTVQRLVTRLERILQGMVADPGQRLSAIELLDEVESGQLDVLGNRGVLGETGVGVS
ncbi:condensation domain-containing protein, partial [Nocardia sp. NPDC057272]|uniref:condensation domain-containing protein n=1 Tax=Nocardia sp. NPDC057272 TaxID=3346079 RepID=UPI00363FA268